jgi:hypothetical protein
MPYSDLVPTGEILSPFLWIIVPLEIKNSTSNIILKITSHSDETAIFTMQNVLDNPIKNLYQKSCTVYQQSC